MRTAWLALAVGCAGAPDEQTETEPACACDRVPLPDPPITDLDGFAALVEQARPELYPDLEGVRIRVEALDDVRYFQANVDLATAGLEPRDRQYVIQVDPVVFDDPPSGEAFISLVAHEVGHVQDYVGMDTEAFADFALWYLEGDVAEYERATDEKSLERGCAAGLTAYKEWLEVHAEPEVLALKEQNYLSIEEIEAWTDAGNTCSLP